MSWRFVAFAIALALAQPHASYAWGLRTHRWIAERAIETLPEPLRAYYRENRERLSDDAVAPDVLLRKRDGEREERRHYVHLESYAKELEALANLEREEAEKRFGRRHVREAGWLPWVIVDHARGIERAMRRGDWKSAIRTSGFAAHYLGDAFMPLHTTSNFDGQKSAAGGGLHEALERGVIDRDLAAFTTGIERNLATASTEPFTRPSVMTLLRDVHRDVAPLVAAHEAAARRAAVGSDRYLDELDRKTRAILQRRLADSVHGVGSLWLSAWVAAGRPAVPALK